MQELELLLALPVRLALGLESASQLEPGLVPERQLDVAVRLTVLVRSQQVLEPEMTRVKR